MPADEQPLRPDTSEVREDPRDDGIRLRLRLALGMLAFLGLTASVVYFAVLRSSPRVSPLPVSSLVGQAQPITPRGLPGPRHQAEGAPAPSFAAPSFRGGTITLSDFRGKGVVMNFFASWCAPCRAEAQDLEAMYQKYRGKGIVFLGVNFEQDSWEDARRFLKDFGITYPAIRDEEGEIAKKYRLVGLPTTYFIKKDGILQSAFIGPFLGTEGLKELERRIEMIVP